MKFFNKKIISGAIALVTLFSFILPALATRTENARSVTLGFTDIEAREVKNITYQIVGVTLSGEDDSFDINSICNNYMKINTYLIFFINFYIYTLCRTSSL